MTRRSPDTSQAPFWRALPALGLIAVLGLCLRLAGLDSPLRTGGDEELFYAPTAALAGRISSGGDAAAGYFAHPPIAQLVMAPGALLGGLDVRPATAAERAGEDPVPRFVFGDDTPILGVYRADGVDPATAVAEMQPRLPPYEHPAGESAWKSLGDYAMERIAGGERFLYLLPDLPVIHERYAGLTSWRIEPVKVVAEGREIRLLFSDDTLIATIELPAPIAGAVSIARPAEADFGPITLWAILSGGSVATIEMMPEIGANAPVATVHGPGQFGGRLTFIASGMRETIARRDDAAVLLLDSVGRPLAVAEAPDGTISSARTDAEGRTYWLLQGDDGIDYVIRPQTLAGARAGSALFGSLGVLIAALIVAIAGGRMVTILLAALFVAIDPAGIIAGRTLLTDGPTGVAVGLMLLGGVAFFAKRTTRRARLMGVGIGTLLAAKFVLWALLPIGLAIIATRLRHGVPLATFLLLLLTGAAAGNALSTTPAGPWGPLLVAAVVVVAARRLLAWEPAVGTIRETRLILAGAGVTIIGLYGLFLALAGMAPLEGLRAYLEGIAYQVTVRGDYESQWWGWPFGYGLMELRSSALDRELFGLSPAIALLAVGGVLHARALRIPGLIAATAFATWAGWGMVTRFALTSNAAHLSIPFAVVAAMAAVSIVGERRAAAGSLLLALLAAPPAFELAAATPLVVGGAVLAALLLGTLLGARAPSIPAPAALLVLVVAIAVPRLMAIDAPTGSATLLGMVAAGWAGGSLIRGGRGAWAIGAGVVLAAAATLPMALGIGDELSTRLMRLDLAPSLIDALATGPGLAEGVVAPASLVVGGALFGVGAFLLALLHHRRSTGTQQKKRSRRA